MISERVLASEAGVKAAATLFALAVGVSAPFASGAAASALAEDPITLEGAVTINGKSAWAGVGITIQTVADGEDEEAAECGTGTADASGRYSVTLDVACGSLTKVVAVLLPSATTAAAETYVLTAGGESHVYNPAFQVTEAELPSLPPQPTLALEGVVSLNGEPAWEGIVVNIEIAPTLASADDQTDETSTTDPSGEAAAGSGSALCGAAPTTSGGSYRVTLDSSCTAGTRVVAVLGQLDVRRAADPVTLQAESGAQAYNPVFALSSSEVAVLPQPQTTAVEDVAGTALLNRSESVFEDVAPLLIALLIASFLLLVAMALAQLQVSNRRYDFLTKTIGALDHTDKKELEFLKESMRVENKIQESRNRVFRWMVEGLVMSFVVIAVIALGAAGKIDAQGVVSVLAAMVGYAAGRATS